MKPAPDRAENKQKKKKGDQKKAKKKIYVLIG